MCNCRVVEDDLHARLAEVVQLLVDIVVERAHSEGQRVDTEKVSVSPYMTPAEAASYARCSRQRIYDLRSDGTLGDHGDGRKALVDRAELDAYLRGRPGRCG